jgi:cytochrome P450
VFVNLLVAGRDTTSQTLAWTLHHLAHNQDKQNTLFQELTARGSEHPKWKTHTDGGKEKKEKQHSVFCLTKISLSALPYLNAVLKVRIKAKRMSFVFLFVFLRFDNRTTRKEGLRLSPPVPVDVKVCVKVRNK